MSEPGLEPDLVGEADDYMCRVSDDEALEAARDMLEDVAHKTRACHNARCRLDRTHGRLVDEDA